MPIQRFASFMFSSRSPLVVRQSLTSLTATIVLRLSLTTTGLAHSLGLFVPSVDLVELTRLLLVLRSSFTSVASSSYFSEMASDVLRIALVSETKTHMKKLLEEFVWPMYCNGRKVGYSIRRKQMSEDEMYVMQHLRGVSMGAGVILRPSEKESLDGELTYMRARFQRVVGRTLKHSTFNQDGCQGLEFSIFFVIAH